MRFSRVFTTASLLFVISLFVAGPAPAAFAEIKIKVVDPADAAVAGAQVELLKAGNPIPAAALSTSAEGLVIFREAPSAADRIQVLAPGFAAQTVDLSSASDAVTVKLLLAPAAETVVVTATRTPVPAQAAGADVDVLSGAQLELMQPGSADDAMRFLPGAIVNTYGQRGGLSSLFVRGGESTYNKVIVDGVAISEPGETFDFGTLPLA